MRILLVNPPPGELTMGLRDIAKVEPLGLEIIGASVPEHDVRLVDMQFEADIHRELREFRPHIVGFSGGIVQTYTARRLAEKVRAFDPDILTVVGGHHATLCPHDFAVPEVDVIVLGEGVEAFREIVARFSRDESFDDVEGLAFPELGALRRTPARALPRNLDHQPLPDRSLTARYRDRYYYIHESPLALVQTSMGCTFPCTFCSCRHFTQRHHIPRSPERIVEDLQRVEEEFVIFCDDHTFLRPDRMEQLHDLIKEAGIEKRYFAYSRVDCVTDNPELFRKWGEIGLEMLMTGLEAVDDVRLAAMEKRTEADTNERAIAILADCGIGVSAGFVIMPDFDEADFQRIDDYIEAHPNIVLTELTPFTPLPGTDLYAEMTGELLSQNREIFDLFHFVVPTTLSQERMYELMSRYYLKILIRTVRRLKLLRPSIVFQRHTPALLRGLSTAVGRLGRAHEATRAPHRKLN